jgi:hypothetical protein
MLQFAAVAGFCKVAPVDAHWPAAAAAAATASQPAAAAGPARRLEYCNGEWFPLCWNHRCSYTGDSHSRAGGLLQWLLYDHGITALSRDSEMSIRKNIIVECRVRAIGTAVGVL